MFDRKAYATLDEARRRLGASVVLVDGRPEYVCGVYQFQHLSFDDLYRNIHPSIMKALIGPKFKTAKTRNELAELWIKTRQEKADEWGQFQLQLSRERIIPLSSPSVDIKPFPVGMMNHPQAGAVYLHRLPSRARYRQGLTAAHLRPHICMYQPGVRFQCNDLMLTEDFFVAAAQGVFPTLEEVLRTIEAAQGQPVSVAFSRDFAISRDELGLSFLHYRQYKIGWAADDNVSFVLSPAFKFLQETLQQSGIRFAQKGA